MDPGSLSSVLDANFNQRLRSRLNYEACYEIKVYLRKLR